MNARQIEVFRTVMRCGTLTSAARVLNVSQPSLSQTLLHMEDQLGLKLFERVKGRLVPTPEAEQLFPEADRIFREMESLRRLAAGLKQGSAGLLRLVASAPPAMSLVPQAIESFRRTCPGVRLISYVVPGDVAVEMLERGDAELGVIMNDTPRPLLETRVVGRAEIVCVLPVSHPLADRAVVTLDDLADLTVVSYRRDSLPGMLIERQFARAGRRLRPAVEIDTSFIAFSFVKQGLGVALVDGLVDWEAFAGVTARPFRPRIPLPICLLASNQRPASHSQAVLTELIAAGVEEKGFGLV